MSDILERVRRHFAFSEIEFREYANTAPHRYKTYRIRKRSGGTREISQPSKDLKSIQRFILSECLLRQFEFHECATAYRVGKNITHNVEPHLENPFLLKMDFKDFFPSIRANDFVAYLLGRGIATSEEEATILSKIFFKRSRLGLRLSIGSPGSPSISNALLWEFDGETSSMCDNYGIAYTRYSDDLTFSTDVEGALFKIPRRIARILSKMSRPKLQINFEKTIFSSRKFNRHVTGVTITNEGQMSLGRQTKRRLRSAVFNARHLELEELASLRGYLSFARQIEPNFLERLTQKYPFDMRYILEGGFLSDFDESAG